MPGRTRGETRALRDASRDYAHRHGIPLDHAAMVSMLAKGEATNEIVRQHGASKDSPGLGSRVVLTFGLFCLLIYLSLGLLGGSLLLFLPCFIFPGLFSVKLPR